jgi:O-antigen/teichoic acid export membrane protein
MPFTDRYTSSLKAVGTEAVWVALGQGVAALGGIVGVRCLTTYLNPSCYGELALALTIVMLSQQLILGPLGQALMRFFAPMQEANRLPAFFRAAALLLSQASGILLLVAIASSLGLWALGQARWAWIVALATPLAVLVGCNGALDGVQNAARHRIVVAWHQGIGQWLRFGLAIFLITILGSSSIVALFGYALGAAIVLTSQLVFLEKHLAKRIAQTGDDEDFKDSVRQMRNYAWPFSGWGLFTWAQLASDRWALQMFTCTGTVGLYAALFQVGYNPLYLVAGFAVQLFQPIVFSWAGDASDAARLNRAYRLNYTLLLGSLAVTVVGTIVAFVFHNQIFCLVVAPQYRHVAGFLPYMVLASGLFASGQIASTIFLIAGKTERLLGPKIGTAVMCVILNCLGAYRFGLAGVVLSNVAFSVAYLVWVSVLARTQLPGQFALRSKDPVWLLGETGSSTAPP